MPTTITTDHTIPQGEIDSFANQSGFLLQEQSPTPPPSLVVDGTISVTADDWNAGGYWVNDIEIGASGFYQSQVTVGATGVLQVVSTVDGAQAMGFFSGSWSPDFTNNGLVDINGRGQAYGVRSSDSPFIVINTGTIHVVSTQDATGIASANGGPITNSGTIDVTGGSGFVRGILGNGGTLINSGTIHVDDGGAPGVASAIIWSNGTITNTGTISGDEALNTSSLSIDNSGTMTGSINLGTTDSVLTNSGTINGPVSLGAGADRYDGHAGVLNGTLDAGDGADSVQGGAGAETISGGAGDDTLAGGGGADRLSGGGGVDHFVLAHGDSGITAGALDVVTDWNASDHITFGTLIGTSGDYFETTAADYTSALALANARIASGASDIVSVVVDGDVVVFADTANDNGSADDAVVLQGHGLADVDFTDFGPLPPPPPPPPISPPPISPPPISPPPISPPPISPPPPPPVSPPPPISPPPPVSGPVEPTEPSSLIPQTNGARGTVTGDMDHAHLGHLLGSDITFATAGGLQLDGTGGVSLNLGGTGFTYDQNEQLTGGSLFSVSFSDVTVSGPFHADLTLGGLSAAPFAAAVQTDATQQTFSGLLQGDDALNGGPAADLLRGYAGGDLLFGEGGNDTIWGGTGDDFIYGAAGAGPQPANIPVGSTYLRGEEGDDHIFGGAGFDDINGNQGADTLVGGVGDDWVVGGKDGDIQFGDAGGDVVWGNLGDDTLVGGEGADQVRGGQGDDLLWGDSGNDYVSGDRGNDTITGGTGADLFHGSQDAGIDRVLDFHIAEGDRVMLDPGTTYTVSQVGADTVIAMGGGNQMILVGVQMSTLTGNWIFEG